MASQKDQSPRSSQELLEWFTVSYRTLYIASGVVVVLLLGLAYWFFAVRRPAGPVAKPAPTQMSARFASIDGSVQVKFAGTLQWLPADRSMVLNKGDLVRTGSGAAAEIRFFDNTVFQIRPDTLVTIEQSFEDPTSKQRQVAAHIQLGVVNFQAPVRNVPGSATTITTNTQRTTTSDDGAGTVEARQTGTEIRIFRGTAQVESQTGEKVNLAANTAVKTDTSGKLGPKVTLPSAPTILAPGNQTEISYPDPPRAVTLLVWKPLPEATGYRVIVDVTANLARPLVDRRDWKPTSMELLGLDPGTYYWQVAALDKAAVEGSFSELARFTVVKAASQAAGAQPTLALQPAVLQGNILQIKGHTDPGASITVNGQRIDVTEDGAFNEFITLEPGQTAVMVRATGRTGSVREQRVGPRH